MNHANRIARLDYARALVAERLRAKRKEYRPALPPPRYDEVFIEGLEWLNRKACSITVVDSELDQSTTGATAPEHRLYILVRP